MGRPASPLLGMRIGCETVTERVIRPGEDDGHSRSSWRVVCQCRVSRVVYANNLLRWPRIKCPHVPEGHRVIGPKEIAVLEAMALVPSDKLEWSLDDDDRYAPKFLATAAAAELARRGA